MNELQWLEKIHQDLIGLQLLIAWVAGVMILIIFTTRK